MSSPCESIRPCSSRSDHQRWVGAVLAPVAESGNPSNCAPPKVKTGAWYKSAGGLVSRIKALVEHQKPVLMNGYKADREHIKNNHLRRPSDSSSESTHDEAHACRPCFILEDSTITEESKDRTMSLSRCPDCQSVLKWGFEDEVQDGQYYASLKPVLCLCQEWVHQETELPGILHM